MTDTADTSGPAVNSRAARSGAGRRLRQHYLQIHPGCATAAADSMTEWESAAANGATLGWALRAAGTTASEVALSEAMRYSVLGALRLASAAPVGVIDGLFANDWTLHGLNDLMTWTGTKSYLSMARRLTELHRTVLETDGSGNDFVWHTGAAVLTAEQANLTDLQSLRWLQVIDRNLGCCGWLDWMRIAVRLKEWVLAAGPEGWVWADAGYTPEQAQVLRALPEAHPDRPGPDQLAVMAALQET